MNWVLLALLAPAIYTVVNFIDKYLVADKIKDYRAMPIYGAIVGLVGGTLFWIITGFPILGLTNSLIVILTGMITIWATPMYFKALSKEETTTVIILFQMMPVMSLILGYFLLGESISSKQLLGFIIILTSVILASIKPMGKKEGFKISSVLFLVLIVDFMWALSGVLINFAIEANSFSEILSYESWGIGLGGLILFILFPSIRNAFLTSFKKIKKPTLGVVFTNEFIFVLAKGITFLAYAAGPVALVSVLSGTQVFYGLLYGIVLTLLLPKLFKEDLNRATLIKKGILGLAVLAGIILISS
jgi:uncharacterized membrane protein